MLESDSRLLPSHTIQSIGMLLEHPLNFLMADVTPSFLLITMFLWEGIGRANRPWPQVTGSHCSWPHGLLRGQREGVRRDVGTRKSQEWSEQNERLNFSETALSRSRHITPPQFLFPISHLDYCQIGYVPPPNFYPQIRNHQPPVKEGYSALSFATLPASPSSPNSLHLPSPASLSCVATAQQLHGVITDKQSILH